MTRNWKLSTIGIAALAALATFAPVASARPPGVVFRGGIGVGFGPSYYGWYGPGPYWYGPAYGYAPRPYAGSIKVDTKMKDAAVYVDGGYAGTVRELKTFPLQPGTHNIELRAPDGHTFYQDSVDVVSGRTTKIIPTSY